jgi:hypothetical protein
MTREAQTLKAQADIITTLSDITSQAIYRMARAHVLNNGFYAYTQAETGKQVFVEASETQFDDSFRPRF